MASDPVSKSGVQRPKPDALTGGGRATRVELPNSALNLEGLAGAAVTRSGYDVNVSQGGVQRAEERAKAFQIAKNTPDMRSDRVAELKAKVANGTYKVDSDKIADGMLREAIKERLAQTDEQ